MQIEAHSSATWRKNIFRQIFRRDVTSSGPQLTTYVHSINVYPRSGLCYRDKDEDVRFAKLFSDRLDKREEKQHGQIRRETDADWKLRMRMCRPYKFGTSSIFSIVRKTENWSYVARARKKVLIFACRSPEFELAEIIQEDHLSPSFSVSICMCTCIHMYVPWDFLTW